MKETNKSLLSGLAVIIGLVVIVALAGLVAIHPQKEILMGEVDASEYRVSNKVPGRIDQIYVHEGDMVKAGDTLAHINSPQIDAKMMQATAVRSAASAQSQKAQHGAREQQIQMAYQVWQKAKAAVDVYGKSYDRVKGLYEKGVVSAQKFDEVDAKYKVAQADCAAAEQQYLMAKEGAQREDIDALLSIRLAVPWPRFRATRTTATSSPRAMAKSSRSMPRWATSSALAPRWFPSST